MAPLTPLEAAALQHGSEESADTNFESKIVSTGLRMALEMGKIVLNARRDGALEMKKKADGTAVSAADLAAETFAREFVMREFPDHKVLGEEFGGEMSDGYVWAFDPIDSTFDYLSGADGFAVTICLYKDGEPFFSVIYSPEKNILYHRMGDSPSRCLMQGGFGDISASDLPNMPTLTAPDGKQQQLPPKVGLQLNPRNTELATLLGGEKGFGGIQRMGGSPALNIATLSRAPGAYIHRWAGKTSPFDLGAAMHILRGAGGVVQDLNGTDLPPFGYEGDVVAASTAEIFERIRGVSQRLSRIAKNPASTELENGSIRMGIPSGGRLNEPAINLLDSAFLPIKRPNDRALHGKGERWDKLYARFLRPDTIARRVESGDLEVGITTQNILRETGAKVETVLKLGFGACKLVVAAPPGVSLGMLKGKRIVTSYPRITSAFFDKLGIKVQIIEEDGAVEAFPGIDLAEAIVDVVESGSSLDANGLVVVDTIMKTEAVLVQGENLKGRQLETAKFIRKSLEGAMEAARYKKMVCRIPKNDGALARFMAIFNHYAPNGLKDLTKTAETETHEVFEFLCPIREASKVMKVMEFGFGRGGLSAIGDGLRMNVESIQMLFN